MGPVGSAAGDDIDDGCRIAAVLGVEGVGDDAEFLDRIRGRLNGRPVQGAVVGVAAVDVEIVRPRAPAVDGDHAGQLAAGQEVDAEGAHDARLELASRASSGRLTRVWFSTEAPTWLLADSMSCASATVVTDSESMPSSSWMATDVVRPILISTPVCTWVLKPSQDTSKS